MWELRGALGKARTDQIVLKVWKNLQPVKELNVVTLQNVFIKALLDAAENPGDARDRRIVEDALKKRNLDRATIRQPISK